MSYYLWLIIAVKSFITCFKWESKRTLLCQGFFCPEPAKHNMYSKCPEKYYFAWIFSLIFKSKGLALFQKDSKKCVEFW